MVKLMAENICFGEALIGLQANESGSYIRSKDWKEGVKVKIQWPDEHSKMTNPYLYLETREDNIPWVPAQDEMLGLVYDLFCEV